jgi:molybdopterin synthase sulfur carrier subunit
MKLDLVYFAWVREKIGKSGETIDVPSTVTNVGELLNHLKGLGAEYQEALQHDRVIRVAIDQEHAEHDEKIAGAREIGIFPPMTGG